MEKRKRKDYIISAVVFQPCNKFICNDEYNVKYFEPTALYLNKYEENNSNQK